MNGDVDEENEDEMDAYEQMSLDEIINGKVSWQILLSFNFNHIS